MIRLESFYNNLNSIKGILMNKRKYLFIIISNGNLNKLLLYLINYNVTVDNLLEYFRTDSNGFILNMICFYNHYKIFEYIFNNCIDKKIFIDSLKMKDDNESDALSVALSARSINVIQFICDNLTKQIIEYTDNDKRTPIMYASYTNNITFVKWIINYTTNLKQRKKLIQYKDNVRYIFLIFYLYCFIFYLLNKRMVIQPQFGQLVMVI